MKPSSASIEQDRVPLSGAASIVLMEVEPRHVT